MNPGDLIRSKEFRLRIPPTKLIGIVVAIVAGEREASDRRILRPPQRGRFPYKFAYVLTDEGLEWVELDDAVERVQ
jgi:hypothetical protein